MSEKMNLKQKIIAIQNKVRISKDGKNTFAKYDYFRPEDLNTALNPLFAEYQVLTFFNLELNLEKNCYTGKLTIEDAESDDFRELVFDIDKAIVKGANPSQQSGATMTYCRRYMLMNAFNISENNSDFDSDAYVKRVNKAEKESKKTPVIIPSKSDEVSKKLRQQMYKKYDKDIVKVISKEIMKSYILVEKEDITYIDVVNMFCINLLKQFNLDSSKFKINSFVFNQDDSGILLYWDNTGFNRKKFEADTKKFKKGV